ncbi:pre-mRNA-processing protein 40A-like isoform X1 [Chenopodium quinoa]|uniref:pre-mRNA-processing protein 40A-like isoform X1 n=1 Tax=Chenopodium quinoa TaxID=63459 RepID=UPI000B772315|nr:pre-mRNA-processing protein 40A-like isoform X1 [Chenopodium quinoa]XP_021714835.1 pre-mRNA-processing protein 40A-like isoform X1 [Chenopodium quinoa]
MGTAQNYGPPMSTQYRPAVPGQQGQPYLPGSSQQFLAPGQNMPSGPNQPMQFSQPMQYSQPMQQLPHRPGMPGGPMSSQGMNMPYGQPNRPMNLGAQQNQHSAPPFGNHASGVGGMGAPFSSSYTFQPVSHLSAPAAPAPVGSQPWLSSGSQSSVPFVPVPQTADQSSVSAPAVPAVNPSDTSQQSSSDWQEHNTSDGRRYYYNKKTKQSSWEKPLELMTPTERADASTVWKEFTTPEGKKYYYNKVTKESKWTIPEDLKLAREQAEKEFSQGDAGLISQPAATVSLTSEEASPAAPVLASSNGLLSASGVSSNPLSFPPAVNPLPVVNVASSEPSVEHSIAPTSLAVTNPPAVTPLSASISGDAVLPAALNASSVTVSASDRVSSQEISTSTDGGSVHDLQEARKGMAAAGKVDLSEKPTNDEPLVFANKQEAKNAFKSLLESANVQSDWSWDQAMRVIVNDKRYGALKTLGERKQAFNEYLGQRKKQEAEERRLRQKKAKEEFTKMLEESEVLTSSMKWSKAITMFEDDERFKAVEKPKDRQELFENYLVELQKKEKEKADEEYRRNREDYWKYLESCDFIEANSLWRKVQDRLEDDERCSRLEKIDRLEIFQDYIRYLEKEEEEQKKLQKEQLRRTERKNRDEFRKMLEDDVAAGVLTAKSIWRDYCAKVKESPAYLAVARNISGSTPKDLFEDVVDELENQYHDDKSRIKDAMKLSKITMTSTWTFEEFKSSISPELGSPLISDINLKLVFEEQLERIKEKEEKEAKKRQRLLDDFTDLLRSLKEVTVSSTWEDSRQLFEESEEYREIGNETLVKETFEDYIAYLQEKAREKERKREEEKVKKEKEREEKEKRKEKEKKDKDKDRDREKRKERSKKEESDDEAVDATDSYSNKDENRKEKDKDRERKHRKRHHDTTDDVSSDREDDREKRHRKRHHDTTDDVSSDRDDKEEHKKSRRHGSDRKKSRKHEHSPDSDGESRQKKHKRDHREGSRKNGAHDDLEDGELGEDGEIS